MEDGQGAFFITVAMQKLGKTVEVIHSAFKMTSK